MDIDSSNFWLVVVSSPFKNDEINVRRKSVISSLSTGSSLGRYFRMEPRGEVYRSYTVSYKIWHTVVSGSMYSQASITSGSVITLRMLLSVIR